MCKAFDNQMQNPELFRWASKNIEMLVKKMQKKSFECDCCLGPWGFQRENNSISRHLQPLLLRTIYIAYLTGKFVPNDFGLKEVWQFVIIHIQFWKLSSYV